jgi:hypothetical protein
VDTILLLDWRERERESRRGCKKIKKKKSGPDKEEDFTHRQRRPSKKRRGETKLV